MSGNQTSNAQVASLSPSAPTNSSDSSHRDDQTSEGSSQSGSGSRNGNQLTPDTKPVPALPNPPIKKPPPSPVPDPGDDLRREQLPQSQQDQQIILTEAEIDTAPMIQDHKDLVLRQLLRQRNIINTKDQASISRYTSKRAALEGLVRMTLVFRIYTAMYARGEIEEECESMVADVLDTSFFHFATADTYDKPTFPNPLLMGREQEIERMVQALLAGNADDVTELYQSQLDGKVLPDHCPREDLGAETDWGRVMGRCPSEDDLSYHRDKVVVKNREKRQAKLLKRTKMVALDRSWPPTQAMQLNKPVGRWERSDSEASSMFGSSF